MISCITANALLRLLLLLLLGLLLRLRGGRRRAVCCFFSPRRSLLPFLSPPCLLLCLFGKALGLSDPVIVSSLSRQIRLRPRAVRMCGPLSTRIHHAFFHHVMCLFDTSLSSYIEFVSFFASTHFSCVVTSFASSCPSWASTSLSSSRSS